MLFNLYFCNTSVNRDNYLIILAIRKSACVRDTQEIALSAALLQMYIAGLHNCCFQFITMCKDLHLTKYFN